MGTPLGTMRTNKDGKGFKTEADASRSLKNQNLDENIFGTVQWDGEWYIEKFSDTLKREKDAKELAEKKARENRPAEDYRWVIFHERTNPINEPEHIEISWNGEPLTIKRNVRVALPRRYLNVCDEARQKVFRPVTKPQVGQCPYVFEGYIARRPYTDDGPATAEDYMKMLREGNDITNKEIADLARKDAT